MSERTNAQIILNERTKGEGANNKKQQIHRATTKKQMWQDVGREGWMIMTIRRMNES